MRIVAWNVGHRTRAKDVPPRVVNALTGFGADLLVLTEYVVGPAHHALAGTLDDRGYPHILVTDRTPGQNQVLVASGSALTKGPIEAPPITPATGPNLLHALWGDPPVQVLACRVPMFKASADRTRYWDWLSTTLGPRSGDAAILIGDLNVDPKRTRTCGGRHLAGLQAIGWTLASPADGVSFYRLDGRTSRLDHALVGQGLQVVHAEYVASIKGVNMAGAGPDAYSDHAILKVDLELRAS